MSDICFKGLQIPSGCVGCIHCDQEYDGSCMLMKKMYYDTYAEQFANCPIIAIANAYEVVEVDNDGNTQNVSVRIFDVEELHENCTVQVLENSITGDVSIGWWENN